MESASHSHRDGKHKKRKHSHQENDDRNVRGDGQQPLKEPAAATEVHKKPKPQAEEAASVPSTVSQPASTVLKVDSLQVKPRVVKPASLWNFKVDYNDHFETPRIAYADIAPFLRVLASQLGKTDAALSVYDPYWCEGSMVAHLNSLGYTSVINRNRDFYADIKKKAVPGYDVLVTNPPYSGEHKVSLLSFLANYTPGSAKQPPASAGGNTQAAGTGASVAATAASAATTAGKPTSAPVQGESRSFALLLPVYVATKSYWKDFAQQQASAGKRVFYILPPDYYEYSHPEGTGKDIPPFYSAWFVGGMTADCRNRVIQELQKDSRRVQAGSASTTVRAGVRKLSFSSLQVAESVEALVQRGLVVDAKRPNPKQRQKMKMQAQTKGK